MKAIGIIEVSGMVAGVEALDAMLKTADVKVLTWEKKLGGRLVNIVVQGDVGAVQAAVAQGETTANQITFTAAKALINNPHPEVMRLIEEGAGKYPALQED